MNDARVMALEAQLNAYDPRLRWEALCELAAWAAGQDEAFAPEAGVANLHAHTFFSFNAYGHSPTSLAWLARRRGYGLFGIVDFDVLDGVDEFLDACELLGVRGSAGMETRVFVPEFATREINSPGEPGIFYHMGVGFTASRAPLEASEILTSLQDRAGARNRAIVERVNAFLVPLQIDYARDVLPLTPAGHPTERHIVSAYLRAAEQEADDPPAFWAERLGVPLAYLEATYTDAAAMQNLLRARLMKRGGVGYASPTPEHFPSVEEVNRLCVACGALPCATWLDGISVGEEAIEELLELLIARGVVALNIIPDRNWNIADGETRRLKCAKLQQIVTLAGRLDLALNIGTEMNSFGQKAIDDFDAPELAGMRRSFLDGAYGIYGHTILQRTLGLGYQSEWARTHLPGRRERHAFYRRVGRVVAPTPAGREVLKDHLRSGAPLDILHALGA